MALLREFALTPDVFDIACYTGEEVCGVHLRVLKEVFLQEALVRNLRAGDWARHISSDQRRWHKWGKELLKKLGTSGRLVDFAPTGSLVPASDSDWCEEALSTHGVSSLNGIISTESVVAARAAHPIIASISRLPSTAWWTSRSCSMRLGRTLPEYLSALDLVLKHAKSLLFIDPYLDPTRDGYQDFVKILEAAARRRPLPLVEVHRVAWYGTSQDKRSRYDEIKEKFQRALTAPLSAAGLSLEVFLWDDFHDRYLISDLLGISVANGFDTTTEPKVRTTWTRLSREDRDDVQREFEQASGRHAGRGSFRVP